MLHGKHISKEKTARKRRKRIAKAAAICVAGACCVALVAVGVLAAFTAMGKGNLLREFAIGSPEGVATSDGGKTVAFDGKKYSQKAGMTSILLLGHDGRQDEHLNGQTDFVMVVAIDTETGEISLISIPRDTMVSVKRTFDKSDEYYDTQQLQIAAAFAYGSDFDHSAQNVCDAVSSIMYNIPMNYYYVLDVNGVGALADAVGGVQLESMEDVPKTDMKKGEWLDLEGDAARLYVTERDTNVLGSAFTRLDRQRQFVDAYLEKLMEVSKSNPGVLMAIYDALASYSTTNLGPAEFSYLASVFLDHGIDDLHAYSLGGEYIHNDETGYAEYHADPQSMYGIVLDVYYEPE